LNAGSRRGSSLLVGRTVVDAEPPQIAEAATIGRVSHIVDAWMQHPSRAFLAEPMFESLRRWSHGAPPTEDIPLDERSRRRTRPA
jgi:hypothetical protein